MIIILSKWAHASLALVIAAVLDGATSYSGFTVIIISSLTAVLVASMPELLRYFAGRREEKQKGQRESFLQLTSSRDKLLEIENSKEARNFEQAQALIIQQATMYEAQIRREREIADRERDVADRAVNALKHEIEGLRELTKGQSELIARWKEN